MAVFVFGAGATRGASFVDSTENPCLPPLDSDFFTQLQRVKSDKHKELIARVMEDVVDLFGVNFRVTMENVFTTLEHMARMVRTTGESRDFKASEISERRNRLLQAVAVVFEEALTKPGSTREILWCRHHEDLVEKILHKSDTIISFNYDCLLDFTLKKHGNEKWNPRYGYGFPLGSRGSKLKGDKYWKPKNPADRNNTVRVYKLHGSLHFRIEKNHMYLKQRPYTKQQGNLRFKIIPPEWHKSYDVGPFKQLWRQAGEALHKTQHLVLIGYSLPETDLHSTALFRVSIKKVSLESLVIVNPDMEARYRIRDVLKRGIGKRTKVLVFDTLEDFVCVDRSLWDSSAPRGV